MPSFSETDTEWLQILENRKLLQLQLATIDVETVVL